MSGTASVQWFWNDWSGDPALKACSFASQGVWKRMLCVMGESDDYGYMLIRGVRPTIDDLARIFGGSADEIETAIVELGKWGVYSRDRRGVIYCRRMIRESKRRAASKKGGEIGGRVTHSKQKGIFSTQGHNQRVTQEATQHPRKTPFPLPKEERKKEESFNGRAPPTKEDFLNGFVIGKNGAGKRNGRFEPGTTTVKSADERLNRFAASIAKAIGPTGWSIVVSAQNRSDPDHERALEHCKAVAASLKKGWPIGWPIEDSNGLKAS